MNICISSPGLGSLAHISSRRGTRPTSMSVVAGLLMALSPSVLQGQASGPEAQSWSLGVAAGVFHYETSADQGFPIVAVRIDQPLSKWVRFEVGTSYVRPEVQTDPGGSFNPALPAEHSNLFTFTLGFQARWTLGPLEPYAGLLGGFFVRYDSDSAGRRFSSSTFAFPFGVRLWATDHIGVRGEFRFNEDGHQVVTRSDSEMTAGVFWTF